MFLSLPLIFSSFGYREMVRGRLQACHDNDMEEGSENAA